MTRIAPPAGWIILQRDGDYYPARILIHVPLRYALIQRCSDGHIYHTRQHISACGRAANYKNRLMPKADLLPVEDTNHYTVVTMNPEDKLFMKQE